MPRRALGSPPSRSASPNASWSWTCRKRKTRTSRRFSSIRRSPGRRKKSRPTRRAVCRFRNIYEEVERPTEIKVKYLDLDGKTHEIEAEGLFATCVQHEIDHINGVLFIDHISKLKRDRVIEEIRQGGQSGGQDEKRRWRPSCRSASCSWARPISPCPRFWKSSVPDMRSWRSIRARRNRPDAAWSCGRARSRAKRSGLGCRF